MADEADQYERAWLLLADIYIQSGKFDLAQVGLLLIMQSSDCDTESSLFLATSAQCKSVCESCLEALLMAGLAWSGLSRQAAVLSDCQQPSTKHTIKDGCHMLLVMLDMQDLCRKCIKHNASCGKAWERLGSILEREQAYKVSFVGHIAKYSLCKARCWLMLHLKRPLIYSHCSPVLP